MTLLQPRIDGGLKIAVLEQQTFYHQFAASEYFGQYQAALEGNGGVASNFSSASDILRYRVLHSEGGIYLDIDDHLPVEPDATGQLRAKIDSVQLTTPLDGLLLRSPVCNAQLGMYTSYNTSMIGSRAGNPMLNAISDEILTRYLTPEGQAFYQVPKPPRQHAAAFQAYTERLNTLTGPAVLNHVIDQRLPELYTFRQVADLANMHTLNYDALLDEAAQRRAELRLLPLEEVAMAGNAQGY
ncbi:glycosyltransferase [Pseudomonas asiatica]|uniref:glycosyltransferase n=1 Tax=Pseudomonas asiatica TaxID=2219225 RepID=UPI00336C01A5